MITGRLAACKCFYLFICSTAITFMQLIYKHIEPLIRIYFCYSLQPLKWELKQKPGLSPPRGGFNPDDPNQQIVAEDIFDEYGGTCFFL